MMKVDDLNFNLEDYLFQHRISFTKGFLPDEIPVSKIDTNEFPIFQIFEDFVAHLKQYYLSGSLRFKIENLPKEMKSEPFLEELKDQNTKLKGKEKRKFILKLERMFLVFSLLGNAYIHGNKLIGEKPKDLVPKPFSQFWCGVAALLDRPPIISHSSLVLFNWNLVDKTNYHEEDSSNFDASVFQSGNIFINNTFQTCLDEDWFFLIGFSIELSAGIGVVHSIKSIRYIMEDNWKDLKESLLQIKFSLEQMLIQLKRIAEQCDPYLFYNRVRVYLSGWKGNPDFPNGVIFEGITNNKRSFYLGASAAQSTPFHLFDYVLGIYHSSEFLKEQQMFMPKEHRECLQEITDSGYNIKKYIEAHKNERWYSELVLVFNHTVVAMEEFRNFHIQIVTRYIVVQSKNITQKKGTGGSSLIPFLKKIRDDSIELKFKN